MKILSPSHSLRLWLARLRGQRAHHAITLTWRGTPLEAAVYHGAIRRADKAGPLLAAGLRGSARPSILVIDADDAASFLSGSELASGADLLMLKASIEEVTERARRLGFEGFDALLFILETTTVRVDGRPDPELLAAAARRSDLPWMVLGVGGAGYNDPWLRSVRGWGTPLSSCHSQPPRNLATRSEPE